MRTVTVEEHFASPRFLDGPGCELRAQASKFGAAAAKLLERLCDVGEQRIAEMDYARIDPAFDRLSSQSDSASLGVESWRHRSFKRGKQ